MKNCTPFGAGNLTTEDLIPNDAFVEDFIQEIDRNILNADPTANYDLEDAATLARKFDATLKSVNLDKYPMIKLRLFGGGSKVNEYIGPVGSLPNITYLEMADFIYDSGYTFEAINNILDNPPIVVTPESPTDKLLKAFNNSLSNTNGCSIPSGLFGGIFNIFDKVKEAIGQLQSGFALFDAILKDFQQLVEGGIFDFLNNLIQGIIQSVLGKLNSLLNGIFSFFDCIFGGLKQELDNLVNKTTGLFKDLEHLGMGMSNMLGTRLGKVANLLSDETLEKFKKQAENFMNTTLGQFEELTEDVIDMVGYRYTKFMNETQKFLENQVAGYKKTLDMVKDKYTKIEIQALEATVDAVTSGAVRIDLGKINGLVNRVTHSGNSLVQLLTELQPVADGLQNAATELEPQFQALASDLGDLGGIFNS